MKWWTQEWLDGDLSEAEEEAVDRDYKQHLLAIKDSLPKGILTFSEAGGPVSLHDGYFVHASTNTRGVDLELDIRNRHDNVETDGGFLEPLLLVHLVYRDYELIGMSKEQLYWRTSPGVETVIIRAEVDVLQDGRFEHRMCFWPDRGWAYRETSWVGIRCRTVDVAVVPFEDGQAVSLDASRSE